MKLTWVCLLGCAGMTGLAGVLAAADNAQTDANPYSVITERNVFHLNPPPPPPPPPEPPPVNLPKVMLTAFVGKGSSLKVYLAIPPREAKESIYYTGAMVPNQKEKDVELVRINYEKNQPISVDILNSGTPQTLTLKSNTYLSSAPAPSPGGKGGAPGMPAGIGLRHPPNGSMPPNVPSRPPTAAVTPSEGSSAIVAGGGGGSAIVAGGGSGNTSSPLAAYGVSGSSAYVGGGSGYNGNAVAANNLGNQLANSLGTPQTGRYQGATSGGPAVPIEVQAAGMLIQKAAMGGGGPPLLPSIQSAVDGMDGSGPPSPQ